MENDEFIEEFSQLPSRTGKDVIDLEEYAKLPRADTYKFIKGFLEGARKSREVRAIFVVAEWGEGKTSIYEGLLRKPEVIKSDLVIPVSTRRLINVIKEHGEEFSDTASSGIRFFACLLYAIKDIIDNDLAPAPPFDKIKIPLKGEGEQTMKFILNGLKSIFGVIGYESRIFTFLDEFEDVLDESPEVQSFIRAGLVEVINGYPRCLCQEPHAGRFHMIIAATPAAYQKFKSAVYADVGRLFGQRILEVDLEKLNRKTAYDFMLGVLKYCWMGKLPKIPLYGSGMFNAIYLATLGNPRAIVNVIELLLTQAKLNAPEGKIRLINPRHFISILSGQRIQVYGGEINILDKGSLSKLYSRIEQKCRAQKVNPETCINVVNLLLSNPVPTSVRAIEQKCGFEGGCEDYLHIIGDSIRELWNVWPFIHFTKVIKGHDKVYNKIESPESAKNLSKVIHALEFYDYDSESLSFISALFTPYLRLGTMKFESERMFRSFVDFLVGISPELSDEGEIITLIDREILDNVETSDEKYIMLSPTALSILYPSPSIFFLDFIEDLDKRFEIGMELMRNLPAFEQQFHRGVLKLLEDGCGVIKIPPPKLESYGFKDIRVTNILYKTPELQYELRAYIFSPLKLLLESVNDEIAKIRDEMKTAYIPLLLIFSWNPLDVEVRGVINTFLGPERESERIFRWMEFPLTTLQCHQVVGYAVAEERNCRIREERWKSRALRMVDELRFEEELRRFIESGLEGGYTIRLLRLRELKENEVTDVLRSLLLTDGSLKDRYNQIRELEERFKIYGRGFGVCPKDIETVDEFERFVRDLIDNHLVKKTAEGYEVRPTDVERRIIAILKEYGRHMQKGEIDKLFICASHETRLFGTDLYLKMLMERGRIGRDEEGSYYLRGIENLENDFKKLSKELEELERVYTEEPYGYIASIKQREVNAIIIKDCIEQLKGLVKEIEKMRYGAEDAERRIRKFTMFKLLMEQLLDINDLLSEFIQKLRSYEVEIVTVKRSLDDLENSLKYLLNTEKTIKIKEKAEIEEKEKIVKELFSRSFTKEEIKELGLKLVKEIEQYEGLYESFRNCPIFDVKIIELAKEYERLRRLIGNCEDRINDINSNMGKLRDIKDSISGHGIFTLQYPYEETPLSSILLNWVRQYLKRA